MFHQLLKAILRHQFQKVVNGDDDDHRVRTLTCWTLFVVMMFAQLAQRVSLQELIGKNASVDILPHPKGSNGIIRPTYRLL